MAPKNSRRKGNKALERKEQPIKSTQSETAVEKQRSNKPRSVYTVAQTNTINVSEGVVEINVARVEPLVAETRKRKREIHQGRVLNKEKDEIKHPIKKKSLLTASQETASNEPDVRTVVHEVYESEKVLSASEGVDCPICLDTQESQNFTFLICSHRFHALCIGKWIAIKQRCPLCKTHVFMSVKPTYSGGKGRVI